MNVCLFKGSLYSAVMVLIMIIHLPIKSEDRISAQIPESPIKIITSSYNNAPWVIKYLDSIFMQEYNNFHVVYIDDCSDDGTPDILEAYVNWYGLQDKITLIKNTTRKLKLENIYKVIHGCNDAETVLILDGDDWFAHEKVLSHINAKYYENDYWFVYGQIQFFEDGQLGIGDAIPAHALQSRNFRELPWIFRHPITFYAWLFKMIPLKELITTEVPEFPGKFYPYCNDRAMIYPMLEMAQYHIGFIPEIAVIQNRFNPLSSQSAGQQSHVTAAQAYCFVETVQLKSIGYDVLDYPVVDRLAQYKDCHADCLICSEDNPNGLYWFLTNSKQYVIGIDNYSVLYQASTEELDRAYQELQTQFIDIQFNRLPFNTYRLECVMNSFSNKYILCISDAFKLDKIIDCNYAIFEMESTFAYTFNVVASTKSLDALGIPYQHIGQGLYAWKFACDKKNALKVHTIHGAFYRKNVFLNMLPDIVFTTLSQLQDVWESISVDTNNIGLFVST